MGLWKSKEQNQLNWERYTVKYIQTILIFMFTILSGHTSTFWLPKIHCSYVADPRLKAPNGLRRHVSANMKFSI